VVWVRVVRVVLPSTVLAVVVVVVVILVPSADVSDLVLECCENDQLWTGPLGDAEAGRVGDAAAGCVGEAVGVDGRAVTGGAIVVWTADVGERTSGGCCVARCG
jgi:hypothetical protein